MLALYIDVLTGASFQGSSDIKERACASLGITNAQLSASRMRKLDGFFLARNDVVHRLDLTRDAMSDDKPPRRQRGQDEVGRSCNEVLLRVNVGGTLNLLEALAAESERRGMAGRLVFASTAAVYGAPVEQPISESTPLAPLNPYPGTKIAAEEMVRWQAATGRLGAVTLRLFNAAGAVDGYADPDLSRIIPKVAAPTLKTPYAPGSHTPTANATAVAMSDT
jgi:nucleoside-diphosphate-sugar epimerase